MRVNFTYLAANREDYDIKDWNWDDCQQVKFAKRDQLQSVYESAVMTPANGHPHAIMPTGAGLTLDANGNFQTLSNGRSLTWDQENRLSAIGFGLNQSESYLYDPDGQRVKKVGTTQTTYYVNPNYEVTVENSAPNPPVAITLESTIANGNDDAQERAAGYMSRASISLSMVFNSDQKVGYRFTNVAIPPGATITNAYVQFKAYKNDSNIDNLTIQGEAADNPATFTDNDYDISSRPRTVVSVPWSPAAWTTNNSYQTPNLTSMVQELVNRPGWVSGNALVALVTAPGPSYGNRAAISYNYQPANAAKLHIEYIPATTTKYYSFNGQKVALRKNGVIYYLHTDHLGGTALVTKSDGSVESEQGYWAYGRYRVGGTLPTDHKFTGQKLDATGLMYFNARYYDPELGIFVSPDSITPDQTDLFSHNRYMAFRGNPMKYKDPTGHWITTAIGGVAGFAIGSWAYLANEARQADGVDLSLNVSWDGWTPDVQIGEDWGDLMTAGIMGGTAGALIATPGLSTVGASMAGNLLADHFSTAISGEDFDAGKHSLAGFMGAVTGGYGKFVDIGVAAGGATVAQGILFKGGLSAAADTIMDAGYGEFSLKKTVENVVFNFGGETTGVALSQAGQLLSRGSPVFEEVWDSQVAVMWKYLEGPARNIIEDIPWLE